MGCARPSRNLDCGSPPRADAFRRFGEPSFPFFEEDNSVDTRSIDARDAQSISEEIHRRTASAEPTREM
jgi:hypothetical protein